MRSRILRIPFSLPTTGPTTRQEMEAYDYFKQSLIEKRFSSAIGWVVKQRKEFEENGKAYVQSMQEELRNACGMSVRNTTGWASCLFFFNQVRVCIYIHTLASILLQLLV